ncbi:MAG: C10 family peptidase [Deltaproteobacteria bacterium]|nr:C10 family peptidase [Deltaproteobacteria bacterium]
MVMHIRRLTNYLLIVALLLVLMPGALQSAPVSINRAEVVAKGFLGHINASHTINSIKEITFNNKPVAWLINLDPAGYILVAYDDIRVPVKGYSLSSGFLDLPKGYREILLQELELPPVLTINSSSTGPEETNNSFWAFLQAPPDKSAAIQAYTPDTFLLTTSWGQAYPYNSMNPQINGNYTLAGCVQTAIAQLMRYHEHPEKGSGVFSYTWNSQTLKAVMNRPFNWDIMPDIANGSVSKYQRDEVAALMRDIGILNLADFGVSSTSTSFRTNEFARAFGYAPIYTMEISNSAFFSTIKNEIDNMRPLLLSMPGHLVVADGYASDGAGKKIHLNLGWDGAYDNYYYLDQTNVIGPYSFEPNHMIYYNLRPCAGSECSPYTPSSAGAPPIIASQLPDTIMDAAGTTIYIDAYDPNGNDVTLSVLSSSDDIEAVLDSNLLTLTPIETESFCEVKVQAQSAGGTAVKTFSTLSLDYMIYLGAETELGGDWANNTETDEFYVYLSGSTTISGTRGYDNQAFYIWVEMENGATVVAGPYEQTFTYSFTPGIYRINASVRYGYSSYKLDDKNSYIINVTLNSLDYTVSDMAEDLGIVLQDFSDGDLVLSQGSNLVSLNKAPLDTSISSVLSAVSGKVKSVWAFNGTWQVYDPLKPELSDLYEMAPGKGYWIDMNSSAYLNVTGNSPSGTIDLSPGWNLVGYNSDTPSTPGATFSTITGKYHSVWSFINGEWRYYNPSDTGSSTLSEIKPGGGYWINMKESSIWVQ